MKRLIDIKYKDPFGELHNSKKGAKSQEKVYRKQVKCKHELHQKTKYVQFSDNPYCDGVYNTTIWCNKCGFKRANSLDWFRESGWKAEKRILAKVKDIDVITH